MPIPQHLLAAYQRTTFQADTPLGRLSIRCGERNDLLDRLLNQHGVWTWAYITAWNPRSERLTAEENARRQSELISRLPSRFAIYRGQGMSAGGDWPPEPSVLVIGISEEEACQIGRDFGQHAIVVGTEDGPAELRDCWTLWPEAPSPQAAAASSYNLADDGDCRCPVCDAAYCCSDERCCEHLVTDWCFTIEVEPGSPRGYWASDQNGRVLTAFEAELRRLNAALDACDWPRRKRHEFLRRLPKHLGFVQKGPLAYEELLRERLAAAPGYVGSSHVVTDSNASDEWDNHWAHDGPEAARAVEEQFRQDVFELNRAVAEAFAGRSCRSLASLPAS